eukprot:TRINITY_DN2864_c0_g1_i6.p1 TRINITY_DN2864_c0_g1~~TRINITY_DN2864_c0_g1_i6.p1  ORF type:complete len:471 (+),score=162.33 TRINITY_DN2864_c0_g1_i6:960-2372(+)
MDVNALDRGKTRTLLVLLSLTFLGFYIVAFACMVTYLADILGPEILAPVIEKGADIYALSNQGATIVEAIFPIAMFAFLGTQIALIFVVKRTQDSNRFMLQPMEEILKRLPVRTSQRSLFGVPASADPSLPIHDIDVAPVDGNAYDITQQVFHQGDTLHGIEHSRGLLNFVTIVGPLFMAFAGTLIRWGNGMPYSGYEPIKTAHEFVVVSSQMCLLVCFWIYFFLLSEIYIVVNRTLKSMEIFSWISENKSLDANNQALSKIVSDSQEPEINGKPKNALLPIHIKLNSHQNMLAWLRIRQYMISWRNIEMTVMNVLAGLIGSFAIWLIVALFAIILHFTAIPRFLLNLQMQVYFLVVFYGTLSYTCFSILLMYRGIQANNLQLGEADILDDNSFETKLKLHLLPKTDENEDLAQELSDLVELQEHIGEAIGGEREDLISVFGVPLTPAIFSSLAAGSVAGVTTMLGVLGG